MQKKATFIRLCFIVVDFILIYTSIVLANIFSKSDLDLVARVNFTSINIFFLCFIFIFILLAIIYNIYRIQLKYASIELIFKLAKTIGYPTALIIIASRFVPFLLFVSFSTSLIFAILLFNFMAITRLIPRLYFSLFANKGDQKNAIIYGAGDAGEKLARIIMDDEKLAYNLVGFIDDNKSKVGSLIHNVKVLGNGQDLNFFIDAMSVDVVMIAIPSAMGTQIREIVRNCKSKDVEYKILPDFNDIVNGSISLQQLRQIDIKDLLKRTPISLDSEEIRSMLFGKTVLVTGAGGSIGSELCNQILRRNPAKLIMLESSEYNLYFAEKNLKAKYQNIEIVPELKNIKDKTDLEFCFAKHHPDFVFNAAAYKHVTMVERNPFSGILNNIFGTLNLLEVADKYKVKKFIQVSTDKAVNPSNVMGATKRLCEIVALTYGEKSDMQVACVRFGNVLGSSGSVIPLFKEQIQSGGPVTVTHPDVTRYFMLISEASQLILHAAHYSKGKEIFVLDMGTPVKIFDLAKDLIKLMAPGRVIEIRFTGLKPGEKLHEELIINTLELEKINDLIMVDKPYKPDAEKVWSCIEQLHTAATKDRDLKKCIEIMKTLEPNFIYEHINN